MNLKKLATYFFPFQKQGRIKCGGIFFYEIICDKIFIGLELICSQNETKFVQFSIRMIQ
jgi:hypothetical protein